MSLKMTVAGTLVQDSNTNQAWHSMYEYAAYLSNMLTVPVGTVIALGTPPGSHGGPWAVTDCWRRSGPFVRGAWHVDEYVDRRTSTANHDQLAIIDADQALSVPS